MVKVARDLSLGRPAYQCQHRAEAEPQEAPGHFWRCLTVHQALIPAQSARQQHTAVAGKGIEVHSTQSRPGPKGEGHTHDRGRRERSKDEKMASRAGGVSQTCLAQAERGSAPGDSCD